MKFYGVPENHLPPTSSVLAVCAHPDDESFGLGAALSSWAEEGTQTSVLCFTHGEASTLGTADDNLHRLREKELAVAADELGVTTVRLLEYPDGRLIEEPIEQLSSELRRVVELVGASLLLVFDEGGSPDIPITCGPPRPPLLSPVTLRSRCSRGLFLNQSPRSSTMSSRQPSSGVDPRTST
jgi:mycothiol S-conjugate amidase